jgi:AraC-like DNA-binding protein
MNPSEQNRPSPQNQNQPAAASNQPPQAGSASVPSTPQQSAQAPQGGPAQPVNVNPNSTQNTLQIAEIRDGIVIMNDGSFRSVVMAKSINFDLMSPQEQEAVEYSYQGFLNSLYFPIQIFMRSEKVDIGPYIEKLEKIRSEHDNMLLALLMDDYVGYIDELAANTNIMDKHFYIVIPFLPNDHSHTKIQKSSTFKQSKGLLDGIFGMLGNNSTHIVINEERLEEAKTELKNRVQATLNGLMQCGIKALPLDTQELIELYYDTYNPETATRQELKNFADLNAPIVQKGSGPAPQPNLDRELQP